MTAPPADAALESGPASERVSRAVPPLLDPLPLGSPERTGRLRAGQRLVVIAVGFGVVLAGVLAAGVLAVNRSVAARHSLSAHVDPTVDLTSRLGSALRAERIAVRAGLADEYGRARLDEAAAVRGTRAVLPDDPRLRADLDRTVHESRTWRTGTAEPALAGRGEPVPAAFDPLDAALREQHDHLASYRAAALDRADSSARILYVWLAMAAALLAGATTLVTLALRRAVVRPLTTLSGQVRQVTQGDFAAGLRVSGPVEITELATGVDAMRRRIIQEWKFAAQARELMDQQAADLRRSNAELEQFAYVASHDLQEPLRKVASFCQMLERRYKDQLDERGVQYINFAVDGARRMQALISDLLAFSRVGRRTGEHTMVDCETVLRDTLDNLGVAREETGAEVTWDPLPAVPGDRTLLGQLFQNLVGNAIRFHGQDAPRVRLSARRDGPMWEFSCRDNGIGIEPQYAERIFLVFQRLHPRGIYEGTGIGLALCKKIVEYHGGRIWLDARPAQPRPWGTTIRWTLPAGDDTDQGAPAVSDTDDTRDHGE